MNIKHTFPLDIFRAYDIRGKLSNLTPQVICSIAHALAAQYKKAEQQHIVIGYDARLSSPSYATIIQTIFEQQGLSVTNMGCCSSPMMYYIARDFGGNGIMVTASHNPKALNGLFKANRHVQKQFNRLDNWLKFLCHNLSKIILLMIFHINLCPNIVCNINTLYSVTFNYRAL